MSAVVFVHGGFAGPWVWDEVIDHLAAAGVAAVAVSLPSCGSADNSIGFDDDVAAVRDATGRFEDCVVVAHSYGGTVMTAAALRMESVRQLVYIAAFMPDIGDHLATTLTHCTPEFLSTLTLRDDGALEADVSRFVPYAYGHASADRRARAERDSPSVMTNGAGASFVFDDVAWNHVPSTYVVCSDDRTIRVDSQRRWASRSTNAIEWPSDHNPQVSHPDLVVGLVTRLALVAA